MTQETATTETAPSSVPEDVGAETVPAPATETQQPESTTAEPEQEKPVEESWDTAYERYKEHPDFRAFLEREQKVQHRHGQVEGQKREAGQRNQLLAHLAQANEGMEGLNETLKELQETGTIDRKTLEGALKRYAPQLASLPAWADEVKESTRVTGVKQGALQFFYAAVSHPDVNSPDLFEKYGRRFLDEWEIDKGSEAFGDFMADAVKAAKDSAAKPLRTRIAKLEADLEAAKAGVRGGAGPGATVGAGGNSSRGTYAERLARGETISPEEIDKMTHSLLS